MWRALTDKGYWSGEVWNRDKAGRIFAELLTMSAVRDAEGNTQQYVALFTDITSIKEHESRLEQIAHFDMLTGLPNRVLLSDRLHQAMARPTGGINWWRWRILTWMASKPSTTSMGTTRATNC